MNITTIVETAKMLTNRELVTRILQGEKELYRILVERYGDMSYRLALGILGDCDAAEDVAQQAFIKAFEHLGRLKKPESFLAWIGIITKNMCRDIIRWKKNIPVSLEYLSESGIEPASPVSSEENDREPLRLIMENHSPAASQLP